jgi:hypothetical protein
MKRIAPLTLAVCLFATSALAAVDGSWTARLDTKREGRMQFNIMRGDSHQNGSSRMLSEFSNLSPSHVNAAVSTPVRFELRREAGTIHFEGSFLAGKGAGHFTFTPQRSAIAAITNLGVDFRSGRKPRDEEETLFTLALFDVSSSFIRSIIAEGYRVSLDDYVGMRIFDVTPDYIREMRALGFAHLDNDDIVASRIHGVTPAYVREMRAAGRDLEFQEYVSTRIHGATPEFAEEMKKAGYPNLTHDQMVSFRIHGVSTKYIESMRKLGYDKLTPNQLVSMRIHGVTPKFIQELDAAGYAGIPVDKLVSMKIHGIDGEKLKKLAK